MKTSLSIVISVICCSSAIAQSLPKFAAKCDADSGKYLLLVSEGNVINLLEKPTQAGPFAWRGGAAKVEGNHYRFSVSSSSLVMKCSLDKKEGSLNCEISASSYPSNTSYFCESTDYISALNTYKNVLRGSEKKLAN